MRLPSHRMSRAALLLLLLAACRVELKSAVGSLCDTEHVCPDALVCAGGRCRASSAAGCPETDAGTALLWSQCRDGFATEHRDTGTLSITDAGHVLSAAVTGATSQGPCAEADLATVPLEAFRVRGTLEVKSPFAPGERATLLDVRAQDTLLIELLLDENQKLAFELQPGLLGAGENAGATSSPAVVAARTYSLELVWVRGSSARLFVDGVQVQQVTASGESTVSAQADGLRLGISNLAVSGGALSVAWSNVELLDGR